MKIKYVLPRCLIWAKLHLCSKSGLLVCLQGVAESQSDAPTVTSIGLDGAITVQKKKLTLPNHSKNTPTKSSSNTIRRAAASWLSYHDLVWKSYKYDSLKTATSEKRGKGCEGVWWVPQPYQDIGRANYVSTLLQTFPSDMLVHSFQNETNKLVVTGGEAAMPSKTKKMKTFWLHGVIKRRTLASCCTWHMLLNMTFVGFNCET